MKQIFKVLEKLFNIQPILFFDAISEFEIA